MSARRAAGLGAALSPLVLAGGLALLPHPRLAQAQEQYGGVPSSGAGGRAHVYSNGERVGFVLMGVSAAFFVGAWHYAGKSHRSQW